DPLVRNPDSIAEQLLGPDERALLGDHPILHAFEQPFEEACQNLEVMNAVRLMMVRTRFIDERLEAAVRDGTRQLVILGAGFDSRAYRLGDFLRETRVFEVDRPATQERKIARVHEAVGTPPQNLQYVAVDFRHDDLGAKLTEAGYLPDQKTFFIWEGVTM